MRSKKFLILLAVLMMLALPCVTRAQHLLDTDTSVTTAALYWNLITGNAVCTGNATPLPGCTGVGTGNIDRLPVQHGHYQYPNRRDLGRVDPELLIGGSPGRRALHGCDSSLHSGNSDHYGGAECSIAPFSIQCQFSSGHSGNSDTWTVTKTWALTTSTPGRAK